MEPDVQSAESSPAPFSQEPTDRLASLNDTDLSEWRKSGKIPTHTADSSPAEPVEQAAPTDAISEPPSEAAKPAKKAKGIDPRMQELLAERKRDREETDRLRAELAELRRGKVDAKPAESSPAPAATNSEPQLEDFDTLQAWSRAHSTWSARQVIDEQRRADGERQHFQQTVERISKQAETFGGKMQAAGQNPEFKARVEDSFEARGVASWRPASDVIMQHRSLGLQAPAITFENAVAQEIVDSSMPIELLDHLMQHPEAVDSLRSATDRAGLRYLIGRIEGRLERDEQTPSQVKTITGAPAVPSTFVGSRSTTSADPRQHAIDTNNFSAYKAVMNAKEVAARKR